MVARRGPPGHAGSSLNGPHTPPTGNYKGPPIDINLSRSVAGRYSTCHASLRSASLGPSRQTCMDYPHRDRVSVTTSYPPPEKQMLTKSSGIPTRGGYDVLALTG